MDVVVGFTWPPYHDTSVSAIVDRKLVFASEEERYTRHKHAIREWPINSMCAALKFLEKNFGIKPSEIDTFAITFDPNLFTKREKSSISSLISSQAGALRLGSFDAVPITFPEELKAIQDAADNNFIASAKVYLEHVYSRLGAKLSKKAKIYPVAHHLAHAASAYYFSGFKSAAIVVADGKGEKSATTVWKVKNGNFEKLLDISWRDGSLGAIYDGISLILKFKLLEGPGKVMGLAPYGKPNKKIDNKFRNIIKITNGDLPYRLSRKLKGNSYYEGYKDLMISALDKINLEEWNPIAKLDSEATDLAYCAQKNIDKAMLSTVKWAKDNTGETNLGLAGGVALNAKANMEIHYSHMFRNMFIFPAANDAGTSAGAAAYVYENALGGKMICEALKDVYLGMAYDEDEIKSAVKKSKLKAEYIGNDMADLAKLVSSNKIIAVYQGRSELGPRALGNRSIVANPSNRKTRKLINEIKGREWWRPLAPSLLADDMYDYFQDPVYTQFMVLMLKLKPDAKERIPAVCHVDNTSRPQMVKKNDNKAWYNLIKEFKSITGEGLVVNTSFNLSGEPLVETPQEAIKSFAYGSFDALYLDGWLIAK
ncbi:MAG: carbamoyltransferase C-terminal domain-containing protein [Candidatus Micrarchaeaceae archaeon]